MTDREKYLIILDRFYRGRGASLLTKDESEALDYAISSIKTDLKYDLLYEETTHIADTDKMIEPTTKNDLGVDAVSRQAVLDLIADYDLSMGQVVRGIHALPSVTPQELKTGHWIEDAEQHHVEKTYHCSECGHGVWGEYEKTEYCGGCGAKMVEPQESEG